MVSSFVGSGGSNDLSQHWYNRPGFAGLDSQVILGSYLLGDFIEIAFIVSYECIYRYGNYNA